ncbi:hypothetical protein P7C73_g4766, partial [Tremellales sp. Uapishka_1]
MSLFSSAFNAGASASSTPSSSKPQKRKRPASLGGPGPSGKNDQVRSTQVNLEKLLGKIGKHKVEGREEMGFIGGKKNKKADKYPSSKGPQMHPDRQVQTSNVKSTSEAAPSKKPRKEEPESSSSKVNSHSISNRPAPAELPLPHPIPSSELTSDGNEALTDLQKGMRAKLDGARFRWINEQLYSTPSTEAVAMMKADPKIFADYHQTHRSLTSAWPSPPLPHLLSLLSPLPPRTLVVDLGCGDAGLARALVPEGKIVLSYDLVGDSRVGEGWVIECDFLEGVPLPGRPGGSESVQKQVEEKVTKKLRSKKGKGAPKGDEKASEIVDVVVCCLSLMGINWVGGIYEACRILREGGVFHIAEVTSRFISTDAFVSKIESFGFKLDKQDQPSTHFTLFSFTKTTPFPLGPVRGHPGFIDRVVEGEQILRGCVYKKR